ncbi:MAG: hypothetical protein QXW74_06725 [Archaeoglobaceae archaeon]
MKSIWSTRSLYILISLLLTFAVFTINYQVASPIIHNDEMYYLSKASAIAGYPNDMANEAHAGYPILISPAFKFAKSPLEIWLGVKVINAILFFMLVIFMWLLAKEIFQNSDKNLQFLTVLAVSLYPMWVLMVGYAFAHMAFLPFYLAIALTFIKVCKGNRLFWPILGLLTGYLYWIHPTGAMVFVSLIVASFYILVKKRYYAEFLLFFVIATSMILLYKFVFTPWLNGIMLPSDSGGIARYPSGLLARYPDEITFFTSSLKKFSSVDYTLNFISHLAGQVFYHTVSTIGIIWFSFCFLLKNLKSSEELRAFYLFLGLSFILMLLLSAYFHTTTSPRLDYWLHGRYVEGVLPPILMIGFFEFFTSKGRKPLFLAILMVVFCTFLLTLSMKKYTLEIAFIQISGFWPLYAIKERDAIFIWAILGLIPIILTGILPARIRKMGGLVAIAIFLFAIFSHVGYHVDESRDVVKTWSPAFSIREKYPPGTCVAFNSSDLKTMWGKFFYNDLGFVLYDYKVRRMSFEDWYYSNSDCLFFTFDRELVEKGYKVYPIEITPLRVLLEYNNMEYKIWFPYVPWLYRKGDFMEVLKYPARVSERSPAILIALKEGWYYFEKDHVWSSGNAVLSIAIPEYCHQNECMAILEIMPYGANLRTAEVKFEDCKNSILLAEFSFNSTESIKISIPVLEKDFQCLRIRIPNATSPMLLEDKGDPRELGIALFLIDVKNN